MYEQGFTALPKGIIICYSLDANGSPQLTLFNASDVISCAPGLSFDAGPHDVVRIELATLRGDPIRAILCDDADAVTTELMHAARPNRRKIQAALLPPPRMSQQLISGQLDTAEQRCRIRDDSIAQAKPAQDL